MENSAIDWLGVISAIVAIITALGSVITIRNERRHRIAEARLDESDATKKLTDIALSMIEPLQRRIETLERELLSSRGLYADAMCRIETLERENRELSAGVKILIAQIEALGQAPMYPPRRRKTDTSI